MTAWPDSQRGAVTLIGALFIIVTLVLMIEALHRMTGSDVLDTSVQSDSTEAIFVLETGIEHASYLYSSGTTCANLSLVGPVNAGRGSFNITNSFLAGSDCRIRVQGSASSTGGPDPATRTVDADLRLSSADGWAAFL